MNRIALIWNHLRASFWFLPSLIVGACAILAITFIQLDAIGAADNLPQWPLFDASSDGARVVLSTIAGSMMTVVGVVYSMILVTLSLAASQYSSRIIRNFMRDRATQIVLGVYTGIFVYCLFVLRVIPADADQALVPILAVTFGVVLALCGVGVLIYFIHHIAAAIQASSVIAAASRETLLAIDRAFPPIEQQPAARPAPITEVGQPLWHPVHASRHGYIQSVNTDALIALAAELDATIRMERAIGEFLVPGQLIASVSTDTRPSERDARHIRNAYTINGFRTVEQDPAFGIQQIVDIALRALSPGINDTNTATMCVDHLGACMASAAVRADPPRALPVSGPTRLLNDAPGFNDLLDGAFDAVRESAEGNAAILRRMLSTLDTVSKLTSQPNRRRRISDKVDAIAEAVDRSIPATGDRHSLHTLINSTRTAIAAER
jgi:uncharacterized membrane protein